MRQGENAMRYVSLFSGIEAASVAWRELGWEPVAFCEIEPFPCAVLAYRFPGVPNLGDITKVDWYEFKEKYGAIDLVVGGSPCQSFSIAGNRTGLDGESGLMYEYIRAIWEIRPKWLLWENVPGVFSIDNGRAFATLLCSLEELGYGMAWRVLDAQFFGVAQRRRRVFVVGCFGSPGSAAAVLFESESVRRNTITSREKRESVTGSSNGSSDQYSRARAIQGDGSTSMKACGDGYNIDGCAYTLNTVDRHSVVCLAGDTANAALDKELCGTLKRGGSTPIITWIA